MFTIYHDPGCIFSHACLVLLRARKTKFNTVKYLKEPLTEEVIHGLVTKLGVRPIDLVQTTYKDWKLVYSKLNLSDEEILHLLIEHPDLMIRPIIVSGNRAVIGRPPKNLIRFMNEVKSQEVH